MSQEAINYQPVDCGVVLLIGALAMISFGAGYLCLNTFSFFSSIDTTSKSKNYSVELNEIIDLCLFQANTQRDHIAIIKQELHKCNQELIAFNQQVESYESTSILLKRSPQKKTTNANFINQNQRIEMQKDLNELLLLYPNAPSPKNITVDAYREFYTKTEEHHEKVLSIVELYLPDTYAALNTAKMLHPEYFKNDYTIIA